MHRRGKSYNFQYTGNQLKQISHYPATAAIHKKQKISRINCLVNRLNILPKNNYNMNTTKKHPASQKQNTNIDQQHRKTKWATFTYSGKQSGPLSHTPEKKEDKLRNYSRTRK
jgi:hypothetical protein